jgi:hypothetical protein
MMTFLPNVQSLNASGEGKAKVYDTNAAGKPAYQGNGKQRGRKPAPQLPKLFDPSSGRLLDQYTSEKRLGIRRETGQLKLKKLTFRHRKIIALHIQGFSGEQIAFYMNCTNLTVSKVLNDPLAQSYISAATKDRELELKALLGSAVNVVREGMTKEGLDIGTKLKAVDRYSKLRSALDTGQEKISAEDIIAQMLERAKSINIQNNFNGNVTVQSVTSTPSLISTPNQEAPHDAKPPQVAGGATELKQLSGSGQTGPQAEHLPFGVI